MFVRYDDFTVGSFNSVNQNTNVDLSAFFTALPFADYALGCTVTEQKKAIPEIKMTDEMTTGQGGTGLKTTGWKARRIFVNKERKPKWRLSELS